MKKIHFIFLLLLPLITIQGQENYTSFSLGPTIPLGAYSKTGALSGNGYAAGGGIIRLDGAFFPQGYLGLGATFSFGSNYIFRDTLVEGLIDYLNATGSASEQLVNPEYRVNGINIWNYVNIMTGPVFSIRPSQRIYIDFRVLGGLSFFNASSITINIYDAEQQIEARPSANKISLGYTLGTSFRYTLNNGIILRLAVDYYQAGEKLDYDFNMLDLSGREIDPLHAEFSVLNIETTLGIAYSF